MSSNFEFVICIVIIVVVFHYFNNKELFKNDEDDRIKYTDNIDLYDGFLSPDLKLMKSVVNNNIHEDKLKKGILEKTVNDIFNNNKIEYLEKKSLNAAFPEATKNICNEINKLII